MAAPASINATGKRKSAIARVYMRPGNGRIMVNQRNFEEYFPMETTRNLVKKPLLLVNVGADFDIVVNVRGGGIEGQAGAVKHALSRALVIFNPEFARRPEKGRLSYPGLPHQRAEEIRPPGRPPRLPVFETLIQLQTRIAVFLVGAVSAPPLLRFISADWC